MSVYIGSNGPGSSNAVLALAAAAQQQVQWELQPLQQVSQLQLDLQLSQQQLQFQERQAAAQQHQLQQEVAQLQQQLERSISQFEQLEQQLQSSQQQLQHAQQQAQQQQLQHVQREHLQRQEEQDQCVQLQSQVIQLQSQLARAQRDSHQQQSHMQDQLVVAQQQHQRQYAVLQQDLWLSQQQLQLATDVQDQLAAELHFWHGKAGSSQAELLLARPQRDSMAAELQLWRQWGAQQQALEEQQQFDSVEAAAWVSSPSPQELAAAICEPGYSPYAPATPCASRSSDAAPSSSSSSSPVSAALNFNSSGCSTWSGAAPLGNPLASSIARDSGSFAVSAAGGSIWFDSGSFAVSGGGTGDAIGSVPPSPLVSWLAPSFGGFSGGFVFGGYAPAAPQVRSRVGFASSAAAAAQPVQLPERTAGGLDQVPWSKSFGGPGPPSRNA